MKNCFSYPQEISQCGRKIMLNAQNKKDVDIHMPDEYNLNYIIHMK